MKSSSPTLDRWPGDSICGDIAIAVLAAGSGARFGGGKLDADLSGKPVGKWVTDTVARTGFARRLIVSAADRPEFAYELQGWEHVINYTATGGLSTSIRAAAQAAGSCERLVLVLGDMPFIEGQHLRSLALVPGIAFTRYPDGSHGVPAGFPARCLARLKELPGNTGASAIDWHEEIKYLSPGSDLSLRDIDTQSDIVSLCGVMSNR